MCYSGFFNIYFLSNSMLLYVFAIFLFLYCASHYVPTRQAGGWDIFSTDILSLTGQENRLLGECNSPLHFSFFILHSTFFILHSTFFILHSTFFILHSTFYILHYLTIIGTTCLAELSCARISSRYVPCGGAGIETISPSIFAEPTNIPVTE